MENYPHNYEPHNSHGHDVSEAHFPIKTKPISLKRDLASKVTLSSEHVEVKLGKLKNLFNTKDFNEDFTQMRGDDAVIITAETFLELTQLDDAPADNKWKVWACIGGAAGAGIGALFLKGLVENPPAFYIVITLLGIVAGASIMMMYQARFSGDLQQAWDDIQNPNSDTSSESSSEKPVQEFTGHPIDLPKPSTSIPMEFTKSEFGDRSEPPRF